MTCDERAAWRAAIAPFHRDAIEAVEATSSIVLMSPEDFLRLASPMSSRIDTVGRLGSIREALDTGTPLAAILLLEVSIDGDEAVVLRHDGRHRAMELRDRGYSLVPVEIQIEDDGEDISAAEIVHPQSHDEDEDYPGYDEDDLDARRTPVDASTVFLHPTTPRHLRQVASVPSPKPERAHVAPSA